MDSSLLNQCLEMTQQLINSKVSFTFNLKLISGFSFHISTMDGGGSPSWKGDVKRKSPSTLRRNAWRKEKFLEKKGLTSTTSGASECAVVTFPNCTVVQLGVITECKLKKI